MHRQEVWFLIADAGRARVVRFPKPREGGERAPVETLLERDADPQPLGAIMADAPGRSFASTGRRRSAMAYHSDPVRDRTRAFASAVVGELAERHAEGAFDRLVVCAPPRFLGVLRDVMPETLTAVVQAEIGSDLTKLPALALRELFVGER